MQSLVRNLHLLAEARVQDVEPTPPIYQHSPHLYVTNGGGDDNGETPYSLGAFGVVSTAEGDRDVRPLQRLTRLERWSCSADLTLKELMPPARGAGGGTTMQAGDGLLCVLEREISAIIILPIFLPASGVREPCPLFSAMALTTRQSRRA